MKTDRHSALPAKPAVALGGPMMSELFHRLSPFSEGRLAKKRNLTTDDKVFAQKRW